MFVITRLPQHSALRRLFLTVAGSSWILATPILAQITVVNSGFLNDTANLTSYTLSFDASNGGEAVDKLIVSAGTESGSAAQITGIIYNGEALTLIPNTGGGGLGRNRGIWYLDNPFSGGEADIVVSGTASAFAHMRLGVASISGSAPGAAIGKIAGAGEITLDIPVTDSFVFAAYAGNDAAASTANSPLVQIYAATGDSANMSAGYENLAPAGPFTYSFANLSSPQTSAAAFAPASASPVLISTIPANDATEVPVAANLEATFSEPVVAGSGSVELWKVGGGSPLETFIVGSSSQTIFSGQKLIINPSNDLTPGPGYYVLISATAVVDTTGGNAFAGISDPAAWTFTADATAPTLVSLNPADNAPAVRLSSNLVVTFSESVMAGTGNVELWQAGGGSPLESFIVDSSSQLTFSGSTLTINPSADLTPGSDYYVLIAPTAVVDTSNIAFEGISDPTTWNFTGDSTPPTIVNLSPGDNQDSVPLDANLLATFSETVAAGTGNIELWESGGTSPLESFDVASSSQITFNGATVTIDPTDDLVFDTGYYVVIPSTAVKDLSGNTFAGLAGTEAWNFSAIGANLNITVVNTNGPGGFVQSSPGTTRTWSFDAGSDADMLVVAYAAELGGAAPGASVEIFYAGAPMTAAKTGGGILAEIYYLDLSTTTYTGGPADLVVDLSDYSVRNGMSVGVVSINGSLEAGESIALHTTADGGANAQAVTLTTTISDAFTVASFNSNNGSGTPVPAVNSPLTQIYASNNIGSARAAAGYQLGAAAGDHAYSWTLPTNNATPRRAVAAAFVVSTGGSDTFADWISDPAFGIDPVDQDLGDDPDGDGSDNGVENFFGTNPGSFSQGLIAATANPATGTFTFTHPQSASPASDLSASYRWSKDLGSFLADGATDGAGTKVDFTIQTDTPSPGITTVTATVTGTATDTLFVDVEVTQK